MFSYWIFSSVFNMHRYSSGDFTTQCWNTCVRSQGPTIHFMIWFSISLWHIHIIYTKTSNMCVTCALLLYIISILTVIIQTGINTFGPAKLIRTSVRIIGSWKSFPKLCNIIRKVYHSRLQLESVITVNWYSTLHNIWYMSRYLSALNKARGPGQTSTPHSD
jgi:hypothetical protein